jgi:hypothetical protein
MDKATAPATHARVLVLATEELLGHELAELLAERGARGEAAIRVVAPAVTDSALKHVMGDVDDAIAVAERRLEHSLDAMRGEGIEVDGEIGDADPLIAIEDALAEFPAEEILIVTRPEGDAAWLETDLFDRARREFELPVTHVTLERRGGDAAVVHVESADGGPDGDSDVELRGYSRNVPKLSWRDLGGILVAIFGSIVLVVLAADCSDTGDAGCVVRYLVAGAASLVNIAHVVGLLLFESVGYRGMFERFFARLSLFGTPAAIVVSLLAH